MSTTRYTNAGKPGTGTTLDNMQSRVKSWMRVNQMNTQLLQAYFNLSGITDIAVGVTTGTLIAPMADTNSACTASGMIIGQVFGGAALQALSPTQYQVSAFTAWGGTSADLNSMHAALFGTLA